MGAIFRITRAEFAKIFKKPTVYIMAFVLVIAAVISIFTFSPVPRASTSITYSNAQSGLEVYNQYNSTSGSNNKTTFDSDITKATNEINYYNDINTYNNNLTLSYNAVKTAYTTLVDNNTETNKSAYVDALQHFEDNIQAFSSLNSSAYITTITNDDLYTTIISDFDNYISLTSSSTIENIILNYNTNNWQTKLSKYYTYSSNFIQQTLLDLCSSLRSKNTEMQQWIRTSPTSNVLYPTGKTYLMALSNILTDINELITNISSNTYPLVYQNKSDVESYELTITDMNAEESGKIAKALKIIEDDNVTKSQAGTLKNLITSIAENSYISTITTTINNYVFVNLTDKQIKSLNEISTIVTENKATLTESIENYKTEDGTKNILSTITDYSLLSKTYTQLVSDKILQYSVSSLKQSEIESLKGDQFKAYNSYELTESITLMTYKINHNTYGQNNLTGFAYNQNSGTSTNAYDFMYYAMRILSILIIVFGIMMTVSLVASEQSSGTIKLLLIRPYSRNKILTAKILAVLTFITCFILFGGLISLIAGASIYGLTGTTVLTVFNATSVITIHPIVLMLINLLSIFIEALFYCILAFAFATIFKSFAGAIVSSLVVFIGGATCNILLTKSIVYGYLPFTNVSLFRYFGGTFLSSKVNPLNYVFEATITSGMSFWISLISVFAFMFIIDFIAYLVFNKRDF